MAFILHFLYIQLVGNEAEKRNTERNAIILSQNAGESSTVTVYSHVLNALNVRYFRMFFYKNLLNNAEDCISLQ